MDEHAKDYLLDQAMTSIASFAAAAKIVKKASEVGKIAHNGMSAEEALKYLVDFMEKESDKMFDNYDETFGLKKKVSRNLIYIDLIPEAPFNPEDKEGTMLILREQAKDVKFQLIYVIGENGEPGFVTLDEFEKDYYYYWECLMKHWNADPEDIEKFKRGESDYLLHEKP